MNEAQRSKTTDTRPMMPPRLENGSKPTQSLGRFIDNLLGDRRIRTRAEKRINDLFRAG